MSKERNKTVDVLRGIAIMMVVLGHTLTGSTRDSTSSMLFNIIWSLQMPLFMLISGYVIRYSSEPQTIGEMLKQIGKKTISYLLPFFVWSFLIRALIFNEKQFLDIKWLAYNMDSGYWFLFSLWMIVIVFSFSSFIVRKIPTHKTLINVILTSSLSVCFMLLLTGIELLFGGSLSFLGIKLTLYYTPFYLADYCYGMLKDTINNIDKNNRIITIVVGIGFLIYISLILRYNTYLIADNLTGILIRALTSIMGCISLCGTIAFVHTDNCFARLLTHFGRESLEIYLLHHIFLIPIKSTVIPTIASLEGAVTVLCNLVITVVASLIVSWLLKGNKFLRFILFGKRK